MGGVHYFNRISKQNTDASSPLPQGDEGEGLGELGRGAPRDSLPLHAGILLPVDASDHVSLAAQKGH